MNRFTAFVAAGAALTSASHLVNADVVQVRVTIENLAFANGVTLSPVTLAAHNGLFDAFNVSTAAGLGTQRVAEAGNGASFIEEATAAFPGVVTGVAVATTNGFGPGLYLPGGSGSIVLTLDSATHRFLSYGAMVVPSNDYFLGNDDPTAVRLFDDFGNFVAQSFTLTGSRIWGAGTEVNQLFGAAFVVGSDIDDHTDENGLVTFGADFSTYAGQTTPAGYVFSSLPTADSEIARLSFQVVPAPGAAFSLGLIGLVTVRRRR